MSRFTADCSRCCGLCCIVPTYLKEQGFPFDKPAEEPCQHLDCGARCTIHAKSHAHGFGTCVGFDCHGAGQWITQQLFEGARWDPAQGPAISAAWRHWLPRFEAAALLETARPLVHPQGHSLLEERIARLLDPAVEECSPQREAIALIRSLLR